MKRTIAFLTAGVFCLLLFTETYADDSTSTSTSIHPSIDLLEQKQLLFQDRLELRLDKFDIKYQDFEQRNNRETWIIIGSIFVVGLALYGGWRQGKNTLIKAAQDKAMAAVDKHLKEQLPEQVDKEVKEKVDALLDEKKHILLAILSDYEEVAQLKAISRICILADSEEQGQDLEDFLKGKGFVQSFWQVPKDNQPLAEADLYIFHRELKTITPEFLTNQWINDCIQQPVEGALYLYFGPRNEQLDTRNQILGFANYREKLEDNLLQKLGGSHVSKSNLSL